MTKNDYKPEVLIAARNAKQWTLKQAGKAINRSFMFVWRVENPGAKHNEDVPFENVKAVCEGYGLPLISVLNENYLFLPK